MKRTAWKTLALVPFIIMGAQWASSVRAARAPTEMWPAPPPPEAYSGLSEPSHPAGLSLTAGDPVETLTGEHILERTDLEVRSVGIDFKFTRIYSSTAGPTWNSPFGPGWTHRYNRRLEMNWDYSMQVRQENGFRTLYAFIPTVVEGVKSFDGDPYIEIPLDKGYFKASVYNPNHLVRNPDGSYTEWTLDGIAYHFAGYWARWRKNQSALAGRLVAMTDIYGNRMSFHYDDLGRLVEIVDTGGRAYRLRYDGERVVELQDPMGGVVQYGYDASGRLTTVIDQEGGRWSYRYDDQGRLIERSDPEGFALRYSYDEEGRMKYVRLPDGSVLEEWVYEWSDRVRRSTLRRSEGGRTIYTYEDIPPWSWTLTSVEQQPTTGGSRQYEPAPVAPDPLRELFGEIYTEWSVLQRLSSSPEQFGFRVVSKNHYGRPNALLDPEGNEVKLHYNEHGKIVGLRGPDLDLTVTYDRRGQVETARRSATGREKRKYAYDEYGNVVRFTDYTGEVYQFSYDLLGRLQSIRYPSGDTAHFVYDRLGRTVMAFYPHDGIYTYEYEPDGNLKAMTLPDGTTYTWQYDGLGRVIGRDAHGRSGESLGEVGR